MTTYALKYVCKNCGNTQIETLTKGNEARLRKCEYCGCDKAVPIGKPVGYVPGEEEKKPQKNDSLSDMISRWRKQQEEYKTLYPNFPRGIPPHQPDRKNWPWEPFTPPQPPIRPPMVSPQVWLQGWDELAKIGRKRLEDMQPPKPAYSTFPAIHGLHKYATDPALQATSCDTRPNRLTHESQGWIDANQARNL